MATARTIPRRALLFGGLPTAREAAPVRPFVPRPPWALADEAAFGMACNGCGDCVRACPEQVLAVRGGLAVLESGRGECTFCSACVQACPSGALMRGEAEEPWAHRARVGDACLPARGVVCASCRDACPEQAIRIPPAARGGAHVDADACTGCGACVGVCPTQAIALQIPLPEPA